MSHDPISTTGGNAVLQIGVVSTCTVPSGTANLTDVDARLNLTSADIGSVLLLIMTGGSMLRTTVLSVSDATHCVLADNAPLNSDASSNCTLFRKRGDPWVSTLNLQSSLTAHDVMSFSFYDGLAAPQCRQPVLLTVLGDHLFGGTIDQVKASNVPGTSAIMQWDVDCVSWDKLIYRRTTGEPTSLSGSPAINNPASGLFTGYTADAIINYLITNALGDEGLAFTSITGPVIPTFSVSYAPCGDAFDQLIAASNTDRATYHWYVDALKTVHFEANSTVSAPWNILDSDPSSLQSQITCTWDRSQYVNSVFVRLGNEISAPITENFVGDGTSKSFQLANGAAAAPTITLNGSSQTVGIQGVSTGQQWYWNQGSTSITQDPSGTVLTSSDHLVVVVSEFVSGIVKYLNGPAVDESTALESGTGFYEMVQQQDNPLTETDATTLAQAIALQYGIIPKIIEIFTYRPGLKIGQQITVTLSEFGLNSQFVIDSVTVTAEDNQLKWDVTAVGSPLINWDYRATLATLRPSAGGGLNEQAPGAQIFWRTLLVKDSTVGNNIADNLNVQASGPGIQCVSVLRKPISSNLIVQVVKNATVIATVTIPSSTPIAKALYTPLPSVQFVAGDILKWNITASDGSKDVDGVAEVTVQWGVNTQVQIASNWQGAWSSGATYKQGDGVQYNGSSYISLQDSNTNHVPSSAPTWWSLLAAQGAAGPSAPIAGQVTVNTSTITSFDNVYTVNSKTQVNGTQLWP